MKIKLKNLGPIKQAEFELGDFTIICGNNNTGKTYATYALFGFLHRWQNLLSVAIENTLIETLFNEGIAKINLNNYLNQYEQILEQGCKKYTQTLASVFVTPKSHFKEAKFEIILNEKPTLSAKFEARFQFGNSEFLLSKTEDSSKLIISLLAETKINTFPTQYIESLVSEAVINILFLGLFSHPFISSAERTGAAIFSDELNFSRNNLLKAMHNLDQEINPRELLFENYQNYALPVEQNVDFIRNLKKIAKKDSFITENHSEILMDFSDIIGGSYSVNANDELHFNPHNTKIKLTIEESSSSVRSLLDIGFYLRHQAKEGDLLIVDEPELNLHPENQRRLARLFSRLVSIGIKVFITTHSDYIVKELNTLIMLNHDDSYLQRIAEDEGYHKSELISAEQIKVYIAEKRPILLDGKKRKYPYQTLTAAHIDPEKGIEVSSFDTAINTMNRIQDAIIWRDDE